MVNPESSVETISHNLFAALAQKFPIACASDEFFYFPQVRLSEPKWETWDCFSEETVREIVRRLSAWEDELGQVASYPSDPELEVDIALLKKVSQTLREQLSEVRTWKTQPTFYLTLVSIGMAEAISISDKEMNNDNIRIKKMIDTVYSSIKNKFPNITRNGHPNKRLANNLSLTIPDVESKALINLLKKDLSFSSGSACSTSKVEPSHVLKAIQRTDEQVHHTIRLGFGKFITDEHEIIKVLINGISQLRK